MVVEFTFALAFPPSYLDTVLKSSPFVCLFFGMLSTVCWVKLDLNDHTRKPEDFVYCLFWRTIFKVYFHVGVLWPEMNSEVFIDNLEDISSTVVIFRRLSF